MNKLTICSDTINFDNPEVKVNKLARYVFPKIDPPINPNWYKDDWTQAQKMLDVICNSLSLLSQEEYVLYNKLCQRDTKFVQKSKQGIYATSYCIKGQIREYKARLNKKNYIKGLGVKISMNQRIKSI